jgi:hypothetical protein
MQHDRSPPDRRPFKRMVLFLAVLATAAVVIVLLWLRLEAT